MGKQIKVGLLNLHCGRCLSRMKPVSIMEDFSYIRIPIQIFMWTRTNTLPSDSEIATEHLIAYGCRLITAGSICYRA